MATVVALIVERRDRERLKSILCAFGHVRFCDRPIEIWQMVQNGDVVAVVTNLFDHDSRSIAPTIEELRRLLPSLPIVVHTSMADPVHQRELLTLSSMSGLMIVEDHGSGNLSPAAFAGLAAGRIQSPIADLLDAVSAIRPPLDSLVNTYVRTIIRQLHWPLSVSAVMSAIDPTKRRSLEKQLREAHLPSAESMIGWTFALHATWLLALPNATLGAVAQRLGFPTDGALRSVFRNRIGASPREVMRRGGFQYLLDRFTALLQGDWSREPAETRRGTGFPSVRRSN